MAEQLPDSQEPKARQARKWAHDWYSYEGYKTVHTRHLENLTNEGLVLNSRLTIREVRSGQRISKVQIVGRIECASGVLIIVDKWLRARYTRTGKCEVKGESYSYQACHRNGRQIIRYDSAHGLERLHRHAYDQKTGKERDNEPVRLSDLPSLDAFIREALAAVESA